MNEYGYKKNNGTNGGYKKKPYKKNYGNNGGYKAKGNKSLGIKGKKLSFNDLCVSRELQALDKAWDEYVGSMYDLMLKGACDESVNNVLIVIEAARPFYIQAREKIKARFSLNQERAKEKEKKEADDKEVLVNTYVGDLIVDDLCGGMVARLGADMLTSTAEEELKKPNVVGGTLIKGRVESTDDEADRMTDGKFNFCGHEDFKGKTCDKMIEFIAGLKEEM